VSEFQGFSGSLADPSGCCYAVQAHMDALIL